MHQRTLDLKKLLKANNLLKAKMLLKQNRLPKVDHPSHLKEVTTLHIVLPMQILVSESV
jgi:hypothetical protein